MKGFIHAADSLDGLGADFTQIKKTGVFSRD